jgi:hypothetical protein
VLSYFTIGVSLHLAQHGQERREKDPSEEDVEDDVEIETFN